MEERRSGKDTGDAVEPRPGKECPSLSLYAPAEWWLATLRDESAESWDSKLDSMLPWGRSPRETASEGWLPTWEV